MLGGNQLLNVQSHAEEVTLSPKLQPIPLADDIQLLQGYQDCQPQQNYRIELCLPKAERPKIQGSAVTATMYIL